MLDNVKDALSAIYNATWVRHKIWTIIGVVALLGVFAGVAYLGLQAIKDKVNYRTEFVFIEDGSQAEIRLEYPKKHSALYIDGVRKETISLVPHEPLKLLKLPETDGSQDIEEDKKPVSELVWDSTLEESSMYLNFLENKGYKVTREVQTSQYIEKVVELNGVKRRIVIFNNIIMVGSLDSDSKLPELSELLKKYKK